MEVEVKEKEPEPDPRDRRRGPRRTLSSRQPCGAQCDAYGTWPGGQRRAADGAEAQSQIIITRAQPAAVQPQLSVMRRALRPFLCF